ncbi:MAG: hypothetical protein AAGA75_01115 [Cyanobacteria bacterium P01_E01_bin.6]
MFLHILKAIAQLVSCSVHHEVICLFVVILFVCREELMVERYAWVLCTNAPLKPILRESY